MPTHFIDSHPLRAAFLGNRLVRLVDLISQQGDSLLAADGLSFRSTAASTMMLLVESRNLTIADIAKALHQPHQLVSQRVDALLAENLIERQPDPDDGRRKVLRLTRRGRQQAKQLKDSLARIAVAFESLSEDLGADLYQCAEQMEQALRGLPLPERVAAVNPADDSSQEDTQ